LYKIVRSNLTQGTSSVCSQLFEAPIKPGIDSARLPREAIFVALPRKVDTMLPRTVERTLPRANLARVDPNRSGSLSRGKGISVCCALSVETVLCLRNSVTRLPRFDAGHEHGKQTNEFCRARTAARNRYPALNFSLDRSPLSTTGCS
jgi:hypothetical protein